MMSTKVSRILNIRFQLLTPALAAFEEFLQTFKTSPTSAAGLAGALDGMNIDEDDFSDDYDFMDEDNEDAGDARRRARANAKQPKMKYLELLQKIADRVEEEITIDLDDVAKVEFNRRKPDRGLIL